MKALQAPTRIATRIPVSSKRWRHVSATVDENMRRAAAAAEGLHRLLPSAMIGSVRQPPAATPAEITAATPPCNPYIKDLNLPQSRPPCETELWVR